MKLPVAGLGTRGWFCLCLLFYPVPAIFAHDATGNAHLLKSAFIYNFAKFTRWPQDASSDLSTPLNLCTVGTDALVNNLDLLSAETIRGRPVRIRSFAMEDAGNPCHVLYIAGSEHNSFARVIEQTQSSPVLTISQIRGFADAGGIIQLYQDKNRIRFKINLGVARDRGLSLSARLLDLAELVDGGVTR